ncbi:MAG: hypothetical protein HYY81_06720, partial [Deltaproteobacteria bacterium]|nr:hypothetical protein [Deltaproteobacteria bacterium]
MKKLTGFAAFRFLLFFALQAFGPWSANSVWGEDFASAHPLNSFSTPSAAVGKAPEGLTAVEWKKMR